MTDGPRRRLGAAYATEVGPDHVGRRVTIRHLGDEGGDDRPTDVVGHLRRWDPDGRVTVEKRDGTLVDLRADRVLASRLIPDAPPRRRGG